MGNEISNRFVRIAQVIILASTWGIITCLLHIFHVIDNKTIITVGMLVIFIMGLIIPLPKDKTEE
jgi:hypothetical protein